MALLPKEVLCYVQHNLPKHARTLVGTAVSGFYTDDEVSAAKQCLYAVLDKMNLDGLPRAIRRQGDSKRKLECDDILSLFAFADSRQIELPTFVAIKLDRLPSVSPGDVDVFALAASVASLTSQVEKLTKQGEAAPSSSDLQMISKRLDGVESHMISGHAPTSTEFQMVTKRLDAVESYMTNQAHVNFPPLSACEPPNLSAQSASSDRWVTVARSGPGELNQRKPPVVRVRGAASSSRIKAVPRKKITSAFVGRLDLETNETDITSMLDEAGVVVVKCFKLKPKPGSSWDTAAFYMSCGAEDQDKLFDSSIWPDGTELRDWYFKN